MQAESYIVRRLYFVKQKQLNDSSHRVSFLQLRYMRPRRHI